MRITVIIFHKKADMLVHSVLLILEPSEHGHHWHTPTVLLMLPWLLLNLKCKRRRSCFLSFTSSSNKYSGYFKKQEKLLTHKNNSWLRCSPVFAVWNLHVKEYCKTNWWKCTNAHCHHFFLIFSKNLRHFKYSLLSSNSSYTSAQPVLI